MVGNRLINAGASGTVPQPTGIGSFAYSISAFDGSQGTWAMDWDFVNEELVILTMRSSGSGRKDLKRFNINTTPPTITAIRNDGGGMESGCAFDGANIHWNLSNQAQRYDSNMTRLSGYFVLYPGVPDYEYAQYLQNAIITVGLDPIKIATFHTFKPNQGITVNIGGAGALAGSVNYPQSTIIRDGSWDKYDKIYVCKEGSSNVEKLNMDFTSTGQTYSSGFGSDLSAITYIPSRQEFWLGSRTTGVIRVYNATY